MGEGGYFSDRVMSQKKTIAPGMSGFPYDDSDNSNDFYSRNVGNGPMNGRKATYFSGMGQSSDYQSRSQARPSASASPRPKNEKPIVGFFYSISRTLAGEFWPLHIGQNTIGSSVDCDIVLSEATVSQEHAVLVVRKMKSPEKVIASLTDARSTNGTIRNGQSLGFTAEECFNGDIITFGDNYTCLLVLIDAAAVGLSHSDAFIPLEEDISGAEMPFGDDFDGPDTGSGDTVFDGAGNRPAGGGYTQAM